MTANVQVTYSQKEKERYIQREVEENIQHLYQTVSRQFWLNDTEKLEMSYNIALKLFISTCVNNPFLQFDKIIDIKTMLPDVEKHYNQTVTQLFSGEI